MSSFTSFIENIFLNESKKPKTSICEYQYQDHYFYLYFKDQKLSGELVGEDVFFELDVSGLSKEKTVKTLNQSCEALISQDSVDSCSQSVSLVLSEDEESSEEESDKGSEATLVSPSSKFKEKHKLIKEANNG